MGVSEKMKDRARQTLERSAEQARFFEQGRNRLVMPGIAAGEKRRVMTLGADTGLLWRRWSTGSDIDPIIQGLLSRLPKSVDVWPEAERKVWLPLLEGSFELIYKDKDEAATEGGLYPLRPALAWVRPRPTRKYLRMNLPSRPGSGAPHRRRSILPSGSGPASARTSLYSMMQFGQLKRDDGTTAQKEKPRPQGERSERVPVCGEDTPLPQP